MAETSEGGRKMDDLEVVKLVYADSSKNISDLKSRQWTVTQLSVAAIMALAVRAKGEPIAANFSDMSSRHALVLTMILTVGIDLWIVIKCEMNLTVFRSRLERLAENYFPMVIGLFDSEPKRRSGLPPKPQESLRVDEGTIFWVMLSCPAVTLFLGLILILAQS